MTEYASRGDHRRTMELLWGVESASNRGPRPGLEIATIVATAVELADADGLGAVSMRKVAERLGRSAMALYTYVPGKAELLDLMLDTVYGEQPSPDPATLGWRAAAEAWAGGTWEFYLRHPWVLQVAGNRAVLGPNELAGYEALLRIFFGIGLRAVEVARTADVLAGFVRGAAQAVSDARAAEQATGISDDEWWNARSPLLDEMVGDRWDTQFVVSRRLDAEQAFDQVDRPDDSLPYTVRQAFDTFEFGLQRLLDGFAVHVAALDGVAAPGAAHRSVASNDVADVEVLQGGVANAGAVVRDGAHVLRPSNAHTATIHHFLRFLRTEGFEAASLPLGVDADGRERLEFIAGDVAFPPYPSWAETDMALATAVALLRRLHDVGARYVAPAGATWSDEMADPDATTLDPAALVICHNDVCLENLVYRDRVAVGLLDFDFAAPGRRIWDLACFARMNVPIDTDDDARLLGRAGPFDAARRLRIVADAYGLPPDRRAFLDVLAEGVRRGGQFLQRRLDEGNEAFRQMVEATGGMAKFDRRRAWFGRHRDELAAALG